MMRDLARPFRPGLLYGENFARAFDITFNDVT